MSLLPVLGIRPSLIDIFVIVGQSAPPIGGITYSHRIELSAALSAHTPVLCFRYLHWQDKQHTLQATVMGCF